jgi:hypothetical protein
VSDSLPIHILKQAGTLPEGAIICPKDFLHLGTRPAIDQALTRLWKGGRLLRIGRGLYSAMVQGHFGPRYPYVPELLSSLAAKTGETIVRGEGWAANLIGLSLHVPMREIHLTSGRSRLLQFSKRIVELRHAPSWKLLLGNSLEGSLIRGLDCIGPDYYKELFPSPQAWRAWRHWPEVAWNDLVRVCSELPAWIAGAIREGAHA